MDISYNTRKNTPSRSKKGKAHLTYDDDETFRSKAIELWEGDATDPMLVYSGVYDLREGFEDGYPAGINESNLINMGVLDLPISHAERVADSMALGLEKEHFSAFIFTSKADTAVSFNTASHSISVHPVLDPLHELGTTASMESALTDKMVISLREYGKELCSSTPVRLPFCFTTSTVRWKHSGVLNIKMAAGFEMLGFSGTTTADRDITVCCHPETMQELHLETLEPGQVSPTILWCLAPCQIIDPTPMYLTIPFSRLLLSMKQARVRDPDTYFYLESPGLDDTFDMIRVGVARYREKIMENYSHYPLYFPESFQLPPDCLPVFLGDEVKLLRPFGHMSGTWMLPYLEMFRPLEPNTTGAYFCAMTYTFPEIQCNRDLLHPDNVFCLYKVLLLRKSRTAIAWYYHCMLYKVSEQYTGLSLDYSWQFPGFTDSIQRMCQTCMGKRTAVADMRHQIEFRRHEELLTLKYRERSSIVNWKIFFGLIISGNFPVVTAAKVQASDKNLIAILFVILISLPYKQILKFLRDAYNFWKEPTPSRIEKVFEEVKRNFDIEKATYMSEADQGCDSEEHQTYDFSDLPPPRDDYIEQCFKKSWDVKIELPKEGSRMINTLWEYFSSLTKDEYEPFHIVFPFILGVTNCPRVSETMPLSKVLALYVSFSFPLFKYCAKRVEILPTALSAIFGWESQGVLSFTEDWLKNGEDVFHDWEKWKKTPLGKSAAEMISFVMVVPLITDKCKDIATAGFTETYQRVSRIMLGESCSITGVLRAGMYIMRTFIKLCKTGELTACLDLKSELLYTTCARHAILIETGTYNLEATKLDTIRMDYTRLQMELQNELMITKAAANALVNTRLKEVNSWQLRLSNQVREGSPREQPFCIYFYGIPGIGKTSAVTGTSDALHDQLGLNDVKKVNNVVTGDKYQSSGGSDTTAWLFDDFGNTAPEHREQPASAQVIAKVQPSVTPMLKAAVDSKGNVFDHAKMCFFTSNSPDGAIVNETLSYESIIRRFGTMIHVMPCENIMKDVGGKKVPDPELMEKYGGDPIPKFLLFQEYTMVKDGAAPRMVNIGPIMNNQQFLKFILTRCKKHFYDQKSCFERKDMFMKAEKCPCGLPLKMCPDCNPHVGSEQWVPYQKPPIMEEISSDSDSDVQSVEVDSVETPSDNSPDNTWIMQQILEPYDSEADEGTRAPFWWCYFFSLYKSMFAERVWFQMHAVAVVWDTAFDTQLFFNTIHSWYEFSNDCDEWLNRVLWSWRAPDTNPTRIDWFAKFLIRVELTWIRARQRTRFYKNAIVAGCDMLAERYKYLGDDYMLRYMTKINKFSRFVFGFDFGVCDDWTSAIAAVLGTFLFRYAMLYALPFTTILVPISTFTMICACTFSAIVGVATLINQRVKRVFRGPAEVIHKIYNSRLGTAAVALALLGLVSRTIVPILAKQFRRHWYSEGDLLTYDQSGVTTIAPIAAKVVELTRPNEYSPPIFKRGALTPTSSSMTLDQAVARIRKNYVVISYNALGETWRMSALYLNQSLLMLPKHFFEPPSGRKEIMECYVTLKSPDAREHTIKTLLDRRKTHFLDNRDIAITVPSATLGDRANLIPLFPKTAHLGEGLFSWLKYDQGFQTQSIKHVTGTSGCSAYAKAYVGGKLVEREIALGVEFCTPEDTYAGSCGSLLLSENKGTSIAGMYVAGQGRNRKAIASIIMIKDILAAEETFRQLACYIRPAERHAAITQIGEYAVQVVHGPPHPKNPVNFQKDLCLVVENVEKTFTPRAQTVPNLYKKEAEEILRVPYQFKAPEMNFNKTVQPLLERSLIQHDPPDPYLMATAVHDYCKVIPEAIARAKKVLDPDGNPYLITNRFLELDECLNGIPGNPFYPGIDGSTSAGFPYNLKKSKVLHGEGGAWYLSPNDHKIQVEAIDRMLDGMSSGFVFNCTLKSEPRAIDKEGARAFQAINIHGFLIIKRVMQTFMSIINYSPELFETVLGVNCVSPQWSRMFEPDYEHGRKLSAEDLEKMDNRESVELRTAVSSVFVAIGRELGYSDKMISFVESVCSEFLWPLVNMGGAIVVLLNLMVSGINVTAHANGIGNSLSQRVSFYKRVGKIQFPPGCEPEHWPGETCKQAPLYLNDLDFRRYVRLKNLGDDLFKSVQEWLAKHWTPAMVKEDLAEFGMVVTSGNKGEEVPHWQDTHEIVAFLKRETFYNQDLGRCVGILHPKSIMRPFVIHEKLGMPHKEYQLQIVDNALRECFYKGEAEYVNCHKKMKEFLEAINLPTTFGLMRMSYEDMLAEDRVKYGPLELAGASEIPYEPHEEYLYFSRPDYWSEGSIETTGVAEWTIGDNSPVTPEITARLYAGEHIISLMPLMKAFLDFTYLGGQSPPMRFGLYDAMDPTAASAWNIIFLSYYCVRGGINVYMHAFGDSIVRLQRTQAINASSYNNIGMEIIDSRVNPVGIITVPCYLTSRWFLTAGLQYLREYPGYAITLQDYTGTAGAASHQIAHSISAAEDFSLMNWRGPPILISGRRRRMRAARRRLSDMQSDDSMKEPVYEDSAYVPLMDDDVGADTGTADGALVSKVRRGLWWSEGDSVEQVEFAMKDAADEDETGPPPARDPSVRIQDQGLARNWLLRPIPVGAIVFENNVYKTHSVAPMKSWLSSPTVRAHLRGVSSLALTLVVRIEVSASMQHSGLLMMSCIPLNPQVNYQGIADEAMTTVDYAYRGNLSHVTIKVGDGGYADLEIPYMHYNDSLSVGALFKALDTNTLDKLYDPRVYIDVLSPVQSVQAVSQDVNVNLFVFAKDVYLGGTTNYTAEGERANEPFSSKVSAIAGSALMMSDMMSAMPSLALPFEVAGLALQGISGAARLFGHSRPVDQSVSAAVPMPAASISTYNSNMRGRTLALDIDQGVSIDGIIGGVADRSHMLISDIISKPFLLGVMHITTLSEVGKCLYTLNVGPQLYVTDSDRLVMGGGGLLSSLFRNWYGKMHYKFEFIVPAGTGGILQFDYDPNAAGLAEATETPNTPADDITNNSAIRINLRDNTELKTTVNWQSTLGCLGTNSIGSAIQPFGPVYNLPYYSTMYNGQISVRMVAPLSVPGTATNLNLDVLVWAWCDREMIFWDYGPSGLSDFEIPGGDQTILGQKGDGVVQIEDPQGRYAPLIPTNYDDGSGKGGIPAPSAPTAPTSPVPITPSGPAPGKAPTKSPVKAPSKLPSKLPSKTPVRAPTKVPSRAPTASPFAVVPCPTVAFTVPLVQVVAVVAQFSYTGSGQVSPSPSGHIYLTTGTYNVLIPKAVGTGSSLGRLTYGMNSAGSTMSITDVDNVTTAQPYSVTGGTLSTPFRISTNPLPAGVVAAWTTYGLVLTVTGNLAINTIMTPVIQPSTGANVPIEILFSALKYTLGTSATLLNPANVTYSSADGNAPMCAEFPSGALIHYTPPGVCINTTSFPVTVVGEGNISQVIDNSGTLAPVFTNTAFLETRLLSKNKAVEPPHFTQGTIALKVGGAAGSKSAIRAIYIMTA